MDKARSSASLQTAPPAAPQTVAEWLALSRRAEQRGDMRQMFLAAAKAVEIEPGDLDARFRELHCLITFGQTGTALERLSALEKDCAQDSARLLQAGDSYARLSRFQDYHRCYLRAYELAPADRNARLSLARSHIILGDLERAQELLEEAIRERPQDHEAWHALARLRTWTHADNHVQALEQLAGEAREPASRVALCYALHKEYEDLGEDAKAMSWLQVGARTLRGTISYRVETDISIMEAIARNFPATRVAGRPTRGEGQGAIFVIGLPRSGTTMVDRILSAHPQVQSLGELRDLTFALMTGGGRLDAPARGKAAGPASPDPGSIGRCYMGAVATYRDDRRFFVDKAPMNFLYAGLIRQELPGARIVLLRRNPMDSCLAIYKTLFREGSPFACDLEDLGRYYVAWHKLAEHWGSSLGSSMLEIQYESLVTNQESETRRMLEYCGLDWDPACLDFHLNASPTATASAAQVRQPLYATSIGRWKKHARELEPLARILREAGIAFD
jgi:tetratricopeptide (TPR) repeat protein